MGRSSKLKFDRATLVDLYWNKKMNMREIAELLYGPNEHMRSNISTYMKRWNIPKRTAYEQRQVAPPHPPHTEDAKSRMCVSHYKGKTPFLNGRSLRWWRYRSREMYPGLPSYLVVHHTDGDPTNNDPLNHCIMAHGEHSSHHNWMKKTYGGDRNDR